MNLMFNFLETPCTWFAVALVCSAICAPLNETLGEKPDMGEVQTEPVSSTTLPSFSSSHKPEQQFHDTDFHADRLALLSSEELNNLGEDANPLHFLKQHKELSKPQVNKYVTHPTQQLTDFHNSIANSCHIDYLVEPARVCCRHSHLHHHTHLHQHRGQNTHQPYHWRAGTVTSTTPEWQPQNKEPSDQVTQLLLQSSAATHRAHQATHYQSSSQPESQQDSSVKGAGQEKGADSVKET